MKNGHTPSAARRGAVVPAKTKTTPGSSAPAKPAPTAIASLHGAVQPETFVLVLAIVLCPSLGWLATKAPFPEFALPAVGLTLAALLWHLLGTPKPQNRWGANLLHTAWPLCLLVLAQLGLALALPAAMGSLMPSQTLPLTWAVLHTPLPQGGFMPPAAPLPLGWAMLLAPFSTLGLFPLLFPVTTLLTAAAMRHTRHSWLHVNQTLLSLASCLVLWVLVHQGSALPVWGMAALGVTLLAGQPRLGRLELIAITLLVGALASATPLAYAFPFFVGLGLVAVWPARALTVVAGALAVVLAGLIPVGGTFGTLLASLAETLQPALILSPEEQYTAMGLLAIISVQLVYHWRWWPPAVHAAWGLGGPAIILAMARFAEPGAWNQAETMSSLGIVLPLIVYTLLKPNFKKS